MQRNLFQIILALIALFGATSYEAAARQIDLIGSYDCEGRNAEGAVYRGKVEIVKKRDIYMVRWRIGQNDTYEGVGILTGDVLSVSYFGGIEGIVVYTAKGNQILEGRWAVRNGDGRMFVETLTRENMVPQPPR